MGIHVYLLPYLSRFTGGLKVVEVRGKTVGECLEDLVRRYPRLEKEIFREGDGLSQVLEIYVNRRSAYPNELSRPVDEGDELHIVHILGGG